MIFVYSFSVVNVLNSVIFIGYSDGTKIILINIFILILIDL